MGINQQQVQTIPHKLYEKKGGGENMKRQEIKVRSFVQIGDQKEVLFDDLPLEERREISRTLSERVMIPNGYRRVDKGEPA